MSAISSEMASFAAVVRDEDFLDHTRVQIVPTPDYHVLGAAVDPDVAVLVDTADVPGTSPDLASRGSGDEEAFIVGRIDIAVRNAGPLADDCSLLTGRGFAHELIVLQDEGPNIVERSPQADRPEDGRRFIGHAAKEAVEFGGAPDFP